ncbi:MAG: hypothetical protein K0S07_568 [Chlamydiales bacterium]|jgi:hypothetical protein|nr:hypothetical protein [Chlamydiales bacterium]
MNGANHVFDQLPPEMWTQVLSSLSRHSCLTFRSLNSTFKTEIDPLILDRETRQLNFFIEQLGATCSLDEEQLRPLKAISFQQVDELFNQVFIIEQVARPLLKGKNEEELLHFSLQLLKESQIDRSYAHLAILAAFDRYACNAKYMTGYSRNNWIEDQEPLYRDMAKKFMEEGLVGESVALMEFGTLNGKHRFVDGHFESARKRKDLSLMIKLIPYAGSPYKKNNLVDECLEKIKRTNESEQKIWAEKLAKAKAKNVQLHPLFQHKNEVHALARLEPVKPRSEPFPENMWNF